MNKHHFEYAEWTVTETQFDPASMHHKETVFTIGNGYLGTRGSFEEGYHAAWPVTFIHGVYDDVPVVYKELANCPDWLPIAIIVDGDRFRLDQGEILRYRRQLDLRRGLLVRDVLWRTPGGKTLDLHFQRFASLENEHILAISVTVTPVNFDGEIEVQASINGYPENQGVLHWEWLKQGSGELENPIPHSQSIWLQVRTRSSNIELGMATRLSVAGVENVKMQLKGCEGYPTLAAVYEGNVGRSVTFEKIVSVFTSRETKTPVQSAREYLTNCPDYETLLSKQETAWAEIWDKCDISIEGDPIAQIAVRYNLFQLLIVAPRHDDRVSIGAKTLSGFAYRGHVFWDTEIFILPVLTYTLPQIAKNLLTYRYHTLPGARRKAQGYGYPGAAFAWESADTGDEVTPRWIIPNSSAAEPIRIWCGDRELHITTDVAYAVWQYWQVTGDDEWMLQCGSEIILETAIFWGTRAEWDGRRERYEIRDTIGPDEYHERVNNNAFTNRMVQWHLENALSLLEWLRREHPDRASELETNLDLNPDRLSRWTDIVRRLWIPYDRQRDLIEQCEGFFQLEDINLQDYEPRTRSMQAILGIEGANKRQVLKQPDVLMLLYLLRDTQAGRDSQIRYDLEALQRNWDYYSPRTDHTYGSSLGPAIHAALACRLNKPEEAYEHFMRAAMVDLEDVRGNAAEGIHAASTGGIWQAVVFGFGGIKILENGPVSHQCLPPNWTRLKFKLQWRGNWYEFDLHSQRIKEPMENKTFDELAYPDIKGVIFDLDGVLTDTAEYHYRGWQRLADEEGISFNRQANEALRGLSRRDSLIALLGGRTVSEEQMLEMMERKNNYYVQSIQEISPQDLLPGAIELLDELKRAGIKIAIGSASKNARDVIEKLGIADRVDTISDGHSVTRSKPAPDLFLHAAAQLNLEPFQCIVVEDAASGVEAAKAAGMWAVGLGPADRVGAANVVLPSLEGVSWSNLQARLARKQSRLPA